MILSCSVISSNLIGCDVVDRYACSLLREGMKKILITLDSPDIETLEKQGDKDAVAKVCLKLYNFSMFIWDNDDSRFYVC